MTEELAAGLQASPARKSAGDLAAISYADIPAIPRRWLWPDHIPRGLVSIWAAHGGTGKGYMFAAVLARVVLGLPFPGEPDNLRRDPQSVVWITSSGEDDQFEDLAPRFRAAIAAAVIEFGLDTDLAGPDGAIRLVHDLSAWQDGSPVTLPADCGRLTTEIAALNDASEARGLPPVALIVADSITGLLSDGFTINSRQGSRRVAGILGVFARNTDTAVCVINHLTQDGKVSGSPGLLAAVRVAFTITRVKDDERVREVTEEKANSSSAQPVRYRITGEGAATHVKFLAAEDKRMERLAQARRLAAMPPAETRLVPALPAGAVYGVGRLVKRDGQPDEQRELKGRHTREAAMAAADRDAGQVLTWQAAPRKPGLYITPVITMPDGARVVYGVQPMPEAAAIA
jgi:AAA domain